MNNTIPVNLSHIGYAVASIERSLQSFALLGFKPHGNICDDTARKVKLQLLIDSHGNTIELVTPIENNSPVSQLLNQYGPTPYHLCFSIMANDWEDYYKELKNNKFILINPPRNAPLLSKDVAFVYSRELGLIEFVLL